MLSEASNTSQPTGSCSLPDLEGTKHLANEELVLVSDTSLSAPDPNYSSDSAQVLLKLILAGKYDITSFVT